MIATFFIFATLMTSILVGAAVPIIFDADFGGPIDDTFAISYLLKKQCDETFDIRLISMVGRDATSRATLLAKFLEESGYSDQVDIGIGQSTECGDFWSINCVGPGWPWIHQFDEWTLSDYKGVIYRNGIDRMIEIIQEYSESNPIYIVTAGALTNLATIISKRPDLKKNIKLFTMSGSLFDDTEPFGKFAEFNILDDIAAAQTVHNNRDINPYFGGSICAVPWDTGYYFQIKELQYQRLLDAMDDDLLIKNLIEQYDIWYINGGYDFDHQRIFHPNNASASLYDLQAVWLAAYVADLESDDELRKTCESVEFIEMQEFDVNIDEKGYLIAIDDNDNRIPPIYYAAKFKEPNGLNDIEIDVVDVLLQKCKRKGNGGKENKEKRDFAGNTTEEVIDIDIIEIDENELNDFFLGLFKYF